MFFYLIWVWFSVLGLSVNIVVGDNAVGLRWGPPGHEDRVLSHYKSFHGTWRFGYCREQNLNYYLFLVFLHLEIYLFTFCLRKLTVLFGLAMNRRGANTVTSVGCRQYFHRIVREFL